MSTNHPPSGPTEQEVRKHFGDKLKADAQLMRPAYTSIWALEDGTLLWDWRNGFSEIVPERRPYPSIDRKPACMGVTTTTVVEPSRQAKQAKQAEKYSATQQGIIAGQREQIIQQREEIAQLKKELAKYRIDLSLYKST